MCLNVVRCRVYIGPASDMNTNDNCGDAVLETRKSA